MTFLTFLANFLADFTLVLLEVLRDRYTLLRLSILRPLFVFLPFIE